MTMIVKLRFVYIKSYSIQSLFFSLHLAQLVFLAICLLNRLFIIVECYCGGLRTNRKVKKKIRKSQRFLARSTLDRQCNLSFRVIVGE